MSFLPKPKAEADNTQNPNLVIFFIIHYLNNLHKEILPSELPKLETLLGRRKSETRHRLTIPCTNLVLINYVGNLYHPS